MNGKHQPDSAVFLAPGQEMPAAKDGWTRNPNRKTHRIVAVKVLRSVSGTAIRFFKVEPIAAKRKPLPDSKFAQQPAKKAAPRRNPTRFRSPLRPKQGWPDQRDGWQPEERTNLRSGKWRINDVRVVTLADGSTKTFFQMVRREPERRKAK